MLGYTLDDIRNALKLIAPATNAKFRLPEETIWTADFAVYSPSYAELKTRLHLWRMATHIDLDRVLPYDPLMILAQAAEQHAITLQDQLIRIGAGAMKAMAEK